MTLRSVEIRLTLSMLHETASRELTSKAVPRKQSLLSRALANPKHTYGNFRQPNLVARVNMSSTLFQPASRFMGNAFMCPFLGASHFSQAVGGLSRLPIMGNPPLSVLKLSILIRQ